MPGCHINDHQMMLYMKLKQTNPVPVAAAKAGISMASAYRINAEPCLPSQRKNSRERRRPDPLADIFDTEIVLLLEAAYGLRAVAIFEEIRRCHPDLIEAGNDSWRFKHRNSPSPKSLDKNCFALAMPPVGLRRPYANPSAKSAPGINSSATPPGGSLLYADSGSRLDAD